MVGKAVDVGDIKVLAARLDGADSRSLRGTVDRLKERLGKSIIVIGSADSGKVRLAASDAATTEFDPKSVLSIPPG